jgi:hypothetical protein
MESKQFLFELQSAIKQLISQLQSAIRQRVSELPSAIRTFNLRKEIKYISCSFLPFLE